MKTYLGNTSQRRPSSNKPIRRRTQFLNLLSRESMNPFFGMIFVVFGFPDCASRNFGREIFERMKVFWEWCVLTRCFEAVREEGQINFWTWRGLSEWVLELMRSLGVMWAESGGHFVFYEVYSWNAIRSDSDDPTPHQLTRSDPSQYVNEISWSK